MTVFYDYIRIITYYLLFMALVGLLAPSGNYKKYISLVMGIVLIGLILRPLQAGVLPQSVPFTDWFATLPAPIEIDAFSQQDHITLIFHDQLHRQAEALLAQNGYMLLHSEWTTSEDFVQILYITLVAQKLPATPTPQPFIRIEPVQIAPYRPAEPTDYTLPIRELIADFYNIPLDRVRVWVER